MKEYQLLNESLQATLHIRNRGKKLELEIKNQTRPGNKKEALDQAGLFFIAWPMINLYFDRNYWEPLLRIRDPLWAIGPGVEQFQKKNCDWKKW